MHNILRKKCKQDLIVHPCISTTDGDKLFGNSYTLKCFGEPKIQVVRNVDGEEVVSDTTLFLDGAFVGHIKPEDEITFEFLGRREIHNIQIFPAIKGVGYDHLEVYV